LSVGVVDRLAALLREAGFGGERQARLSQIPGGNPPASGLVARGRPEDARLATLLEIFHRDGEATPKEAAAALAPLTVEELVAEGLLEADRARVRARVKLFGIDGVLVAGDPIELSDRDDYVISLSSASVRVAGLTVRREVESALDVGTGSGAHALLAARHAERVVGIDVNPHALELAGIGTRLNDAGNVRLVEGDWFEPVAGERFDLVVVTPASIITPDTTVLYRDSPLGGQELSRRLVAASAEHLTDGGHATIFCSWAHGDEGWESAPREWAAGLGCDAILLHFGSREPLVYALDHALDRPDPDPQAYSETVRRWTRYYRETGIERIAAGAVILRRRPGAENWIRAYSAGAPTPHGGDQLPRMFAGADLLEGPAAPAQLRTLLSTAWRPVDGHRLDQQLVFADGAYVPGTAVMAQQPGINVTADVDARVLPVLLACDGSQPLARVIAGAPLPPDLDRGGFHTLCVGTFRDLLGRGFIVPAPAASGVAA
jgi:SAM-dependent methyltransferase